MTDVLSKMAQWPSMTDNEREFEAVACRAEIGIVPYQLWVSLTVESRLRLASLSQTDAQKRLKETARIKATETAIADAALADMLRSKP